MNRIRILSALLRKEIILMRQNPLIIRIIFLMPLMVMLVVPLVATLDVSEVNVVVVDNDRSQLSRRIIADAGSCGSLHVRAVLSAYPDALEYIRQGDADVLLDIPHDFSRTISQLEIEANGVNATKGMLGARYLGSSVAQTLKEWTEASGKVIASDTVSVINRFNPTLNFHNYMIPALMVVLLIMICGFLPSLNLVNEKETGTIEAMNVTPVSRLTFVLSKLIPFWTAGLIVVTIGIIIGRLVYGLAPAGSIGLIFLAAILFSLFMSGLGVMIANSSSTMLQSIFVMFAVIIIFQLMGGLFTPISSMPDWAQALTYVIPPRYFNEIMRAVYLKGATLSDLGFDFGALTFFAAVACILAAVTYRKRS